MPKKQTRKVELGIAFSSGDNRGLWNTDFVEIPLATPEDDIPKVACKAMEKKLVDEGLEWAYIWIYSIPDPEIEEERELT